MSLIALVEFVDVCATQDSKRRAVREEALAALANLAHKNVHNQTELARVGVIARAVALLHGGPPAANGSAAAAGLQIPAARLLWAMAGDNRDNALAIVAAGMFMHQP